MTKMNIRKNSLIRSKTIEKCEFLMLEKLSFCEKQTETLLETLQPGVASTHFPGRTLFQYNVMSSEDHEIEGFLQSKNVLILS